MKTNEATMMKDVQMQLKENWKLVAKYAKDPLSKDVAELQMANRKLLLKLNVYIRYPVDLKSIAENKKKYLQ